MRLLLAISLSLPFLLHTSAGGTPSLRGSAPRIAVVLADGRLQLFSGMADSLESEWVIAPYQVEGPIKLLKQSPDRRRLVVLARPRLGTTAENLLSTVDLTSGKLTTRVLTGSLSNAGTFAFDDNSGHLYLVGYDDAGVWVAQLEPGTLAVIKRWIAIAVDTRTDSSSQIMTTLGPRWRTYSSTIDSRRKRMTVAFHGGIDGAETFTLDGKPSPRCDLASPVRTCIRQHGSVVATPSGLFAATGTPTIKRLMPSGTESEVNTGLEGNHLMEFVLSTDSRTLFAAGSCSYAGGFSISPVESASPGRNRVLVKTICGETLTIDPAGEWVAVAALKPPLTLSRGPGTIRFVSVTDGHILAERIVAGPPIDILALR